MARRGDQFQRGPEEVDFDELIQNAGKRLRQMFQRKPGEGGGSPRWIWALLIALFILSAVIWLSTGIYQVAPGEQGVIRRFGKEHARVGPGLHYNLPAPIDTRNIVDIEEIGRMEVGVIAAESHMITGNLNLVDAQMVVQYRVKDASNFVFNVKDPGDSLRGIGDQPDGRTLKDAAEVALRQVVGQRPIDDVLTERKAEVQAETLEILQAILDSYETGILVTEVKLQRVQAPESVLAAFNDVVSAKEDRERVTNEARGYEADIVPKARGEAERMIRAAEAYKEQRVKQAEGDAGRFLSILKEYRKAKDVTRRRMYLETMQEILPGIRKFIVDPGVGGNVLQFLPLTEGGTQVVAPSDATPAAQ